MHRLFYAFALAVLLPSLGVAAKPGRMVAYELGEDCTAESFWQGDAVLFVKKHQLQGFKFTSEDRKQADSRRTGGVTCFGLPVYESRVQFAAEGGVARVEMMLYNRGGTEDVQTVDLGGGKSMRRFVRHDQKVSRDGFFKVLETVRAHLTAAGAKAPPVVDERTRDAKVNMRSQTWPVTETGTRATLIWNYSQSGKKADTFVPGFIRLAIDGPAKADGPVAKKGALPPPPAKSAAGAKKIADNVVREARGDVFIDNVPMVDQGVKGYCAVATAERVLRYYGLDVDEHEIGEAAGTSAEKGTRTADMRQAVDAIGRRYRLATVSLYSAFEGNFVAKIGKEVANYNKVAKKMRKPTIGEDVYVTRQGNSVRYDPQALTEAMDAEVLKAMKVSGAQKAQFTKFKADVRQYVDKGIPLFWSLTLGIYPEAELPQAKGGHTRLIIGYNEKKGEILYSDSWGKGHEFKRMPVDWAWTVTRSLMAMKPLK